MRTFFLIFMVLVSMVFSHTLKAEVSQEIALTVSSDGPTKEEATKNALRSAIEQAYGAFVSANTTILNDELVKDEIITVSNGSIKEYKEISAIETAKGGYMVTLSTVVSLPHLITYAKNHGSECEFAGNTFGMEMKMFELQKQNELNALYNLTDQIVALLPSNMSYSLNIGDPKIPSKSSYSTWSAESGYFDISDKPKKYGDNQMHLPKIVLQNILGEKIDMGAFKDYEDEIYCRVIPEAKDYIDNLRSGEFSNYYEIPISIEWQHNGKVIHNLFENTLKGLSLNEESYAGFQSKNMKLTIFDGKEFYVFFRNEPSLIAKWADDLGSRLIEAFSSFVIMDNTGQKSSFYPQEIVRRELNWKKCYGNSSVRFPNKSTDKERILLDGQGSGIFGEGIFNDIFHYRFDLINQYRENNHNERYVYLLNVGDLLSSDTTKMRDWKWEINVLVPTAEIAKYSKFWVEAE